jgi:hypothetical protein
MHELARTIPDVNMLLALAPEDLASTILFLLKKRNEAKFHTGNLQKELWRHFTSGQPQYPRQYENEINLALSEALLRQVLLPVDQSRRNAPQPAEDAVQEPPSQARFPREIVIARPGLWRVVTVSV